MSYLDEEIDAQTAAAERQLVRAEEAEHRRELARWYADMARDSDMAAEDAYWQQRYAADLRTERQAEGMLDRHER
jgi:hypothetical protein